MQGIVLRPSGSTTWATRRRCVALRAGCRPSAGESGPRDRRQSFRDPVPTALAEKDCSHSTRMPRRGSGPGAHPGQGYTDNVCAHVGKLKRLPDITQEALKHSRVSATVPHRHMTWVHGAPASRSTRQSGRPPAQGLICAGGLLRIPPRPRSRKRRTR